VLVRPTMKDSVKPMPTSMLRVWKASMRVPVPRGKGISSACEERPYLSWAKWRGVRKCSGM